jgi:hypothetical protein
LEKKIIFPFHCIFHVLEENYRKERKKKIYISSCYIFLFGNFVLKCKKKTNIKREKMLGFFQKGVGGGRALRLQAPVISAITYFIDIPSRISNGDKSEKGYFSYILHFNLILNINIVGGSKMLWKKYFRKQTLN